jgi:predicted DNA-binding protein with PD1-like motif
MFRADSGSTVVVRCVDGERLPDALLGLGLPAAGLVTGIGMLRDLVLGYWDGKKYVEERIGEPVELLALQGNLGDEGGKPVLHAHVTAGLLGGEAIGGHLLSATVHNTAEIVLLRLPGVRLARRRDATGLLGLYPEAAGG